MSEYYKDVSVFIIKSINKLNNITLIFKTMQQGNWFYQIGQKFSARGFINVLTSSELTELRKSGSSLTSYNELTALLFDRLVTFSTTILEALFGFFQ